MNPDVATWARNALGDSQWMRPTEVAHEEDVVADPDNRSAIETAGTA